MNNIVSFVDKKNEAKEIVVFKDGRMTAKNDSKVYEIMKKIFLVFLIVLLAGSFLFKEFLFSGESISIWICLFIVIGYLVKNGGHERVECLSQLQFYNDYLVFYVPKHHIKSGKDQMEIQKILYKDVTKCEFRTNTRKMVICGMMEESHYEYDKNGNAKINPCYHKNYDGMIKFYTIFDVEHDFKQIIEKNSPLKVEYQNS